MTTATTSKQQLYGKYVNPPVDQYSSDKEDPLVLMAQACDNIGKELSQGNFKSPSEGKKSLKRPAPTTSSLPATKKHFSSISSSPYTFDSMRIPQLNISFFSPLFPQSSYLMGSMFSSPFVCNRMDSSNSDGFCGKIFVNHLHLLEHLYTEHTSMKFPYSCTSINQP